MPELYHVMNRGVDKRSIVEDDEDRIRFVHNLFMLNNKNRVDPNHRFKGDTVSRELAITIHAWCLMPNHYHRHIRLTPLTGEWRPYSARA